MRETEAHSSIGSRNPAYAGRTRLARTLRRRGLGAAFLLVAVLLGYFLLQRTHPDVVLVTIDTLRADRIGCYGDSGASTPNLDRLAREGIVFENAVTPVPITLPSHATMMTGLYPTRHGVPNNGTYAMSPQIATVAERFQQAGYRTGAFLGAFVLHR